ncbi:MAG: hypothetical protein ACOCQV_01870 [Halolamina sp.]
MNRVAGDGSFVAALRAAVRLRDVFALALVPAVLLVVFVLPVERREGLAFVYEEPSLLTAYSAHFVHFDVAHLAANLLGFAIVAGLGYVLAAVAGYRRLVGLATVTYLLAFPPVLSALNLAVPRRAVGYGFSGVNMAFAGLLALVLVAYLSRLDDRIQVRDAPGLFFAVVTLISIVGLPSRIAAVVGAASALVAVGYLLTVRQRWTGPLSARLAVGWLDAAVLGAIALFGYQFVGFGNASVEDGVVNVYVHLLGLCLGFIVPYTALEAGVVEADDRGFLSD